MAKIKPPTGRITWGSSQVSRKLGAIVDRHPDTPPKGLPGNKWPFRVSWMRICFLLCYYGVKAEELKTFLEECNGPQYKLMLQAMRQAHPCIQHRPTHKWRLQETNGYLKITDIELVPR